MIAAVITAILGNFGIVLVVVALASSYVKIRKAHAPSRVDACYIVWGELLFYGVGLMMAWAATFHAFFQQLAAASIGWEPSPFEWELAWAEYGLALVAILSLWRGYSMRLSATLIYAIFSFGAAAQHINQIVCCRNLSPDNAGLILWINDILVPVAVLALAYFARGNRTGER